VHFWCGVLIHDRRLLLQPFVRARRLLQAHVLNSGYLTRHKGLLWRRSFSRAAPAPKFSRHDAVVTSKYSASQMLLASSSELVTTRPQSGV
jgi:hypothetical protein